MNPFLLMMLSSLKNNDDNNNSYKYIILLSMILPYIMKYIPFKDIYEYFLDTYISKKDIVSITIPSHTVPVIKGYGTTTPITKNVYSPVFNSIIYYIKTNIKENKIQYDNFIETITLNAELAIHYDDETRNKNNQYSLIPISNKKVLITDKIYCEINDIETKDKGNEDDSNKNDNKSNIKNIKKNNFVIILSIDKKYGNEFEILNNFIDKCSNEYKSFIDNKDDKNLYIYEYKYCDKTENNIDVFFDCHLMNHNKDLNVNIFFEDKQKLIKYINQFIYNQSKKNIAEQKFMRSGVTYKGAIVLTGPPGCGKTSFIKGAAKHTNRHIIIINLGKIKTCQELEAIFRKRIFCGKTLEGEQIMFVLDDVDAMNDNIIQSRKKDEHEQKLSDSGKNESELVQLVKLMETGNSSNVKYTNSINSDTVNLSCLLNILDGIIELNGVMIIMTTNHPEKIDPALIRPGRFDFIYEFKKATRKIIKEMIQFKFELSNHEMERYHELDSIKDYILSPAEVQSICFKNDNVIDSINDIILATQK